MVFLFRIILFFVGFYIVAHLLFRYIIPWLLRRWVRKMGKNHEQSQGRYYRNEANKKEGEVHIDKVPKDKNKDSKGKELDDGEYVDYEEL